MVAGAGVCRLHPRSRPVCGRRSLHRPPAPPPPVPDKSQQFEFGTGFDRNAALLSSHWLDVRLPREPEFAAAAADADRVLDALADLWGEEGDTLPDASEGQLEDRFVRPVLAALGWETVVQPHLDGRRPDYALFFTRDDRKAAERIGDRSPEFWRHAAVVADAKAWPRSLDAPAGRGKKREYPPGQIEDYLLTSRRAFGVLTNGRLWRLVPRDREPWQPRFATFYQFDLAGLLAAWCETAGRSPDGLLIDADADSLREAFRRFVLLFGPAGHADGPDGSVVTRAVAGSTAYRQGIGGDMRDRAFEALRLCVEGLLADPDGDPDATPEEARDAAFVLIYRLLFAMFAEDRGLLPHGRNRLYTANRSLRNVRRDVAAELDARGGGWAAGFPRDGFGLWESVATLFDLIDRGDGRYGVPAYNGGLFDPDQHPFLNRNRVDDWHLARVIDSLGRARDPQADPGDAGRLFPVDYRDLAIEHLGGIYEGMLELHPTRATVPMAVVWKTKKGVREELWKTEPEAAKLCRRGKGGGYKRGDLTVPTGGIFLRTDKDERRATGSYYTPDHVVRFIVEETLGPLCDRIGVALRADIDAAEAAGDAAAADRLRTEYDDRVLDLRVADPAMGSGHFLLRACSYLAEQIATHPHAADPAAPDEADGGDSALTFWKRRVAENCLFGVDRNGMAVELAKLALWLETVAADRPLTFLDHRLRCGDSVVGARLGRLDAPPRKPKKGERTLGGLFAPAERRLPKMLAALAAIRAEPSDTLEAVKAKGKRLREFERDREPFRKLADLWCAAFCLPGRKNLDPGGYQRLATAAGRPRKFPAAWTAATGERGGDGEPGDTADAPEPWAAAVLADADAEDQRPFHWELEFPAVYFAAPPDDPNADAAPAAHRRPDAGFDAVIGNPPYDVLSEKELGRGLGALKKAIRLDPSLAASARGKNNLYKLFVCRAAELLAPGGVLGFIVPMGVLGDDSTADVRRMLFDAGRVVSVDSFPQKDRPADRVFPEAKLATAVVLWEKAGGGAAGSGGRTRPPLNVNAGTAADPPPAEPPPATWPFRVSVHPGREFADDAPTLRMAAAEVPSYDPANLGIVNCGQEDWDLAVRVAASDRTVRLGNVVESFQGEVNETTHKRHLTTDDSAGPLVLRGANIGMYANRSASQGKNLYLDKLAYLEAAGGQKKDAHLHPRVGFQRSPPQNNFRRLIAAPLPAGEFLFDTVSYVPPGASEASPGLLLAFLNSRFAEWYFRLGSTNSKVNEYQFNILPFPRFTPAGLTATAADAGADLPPAGSPLPPAAVEDALAALAPHAADPPFGPGAAGVLVACAESLTAIEAARGPNVPKRERSKLAPAAADWQRLADRLLYRLAGLTDDEADGLEDRLGRML